MSLSPPPGLSSLPLGPTWESHHQYPTVDGWSLPYLAVRRNPYRHMMWDKIRDDAVRVRYWNFIVEIRVGYHRWLYWHFVERDNRSLKHGLS